MALLNVSKDHNFLQALFYGFGAGAGFSLVLVFFAAMRERLAVADVPDPFKGAGHRYDYRRAYVTGLYGFCRAGVGASDRINPHRFPLFSALLALVGMALPSAPCLALPLSISKPRATRSSMRSTNSAPNPVWPVRLSRLSALRRGHRRWGRHQQVSPRRRSRHTSPSRPARRRATALDEEHGEEASTPAVAYIREDECIGCTKCIQACPVDAILGAAKQMHTVIASECTGCDLCVEPCPVDCIDMIHEAALCKTGTGTCPTPWVAG